MISDYVQAPSEQVVVKMFDSIYNGQTFFFGGGVLPLPGKQLPGVIGCVAFQANTAPNPWCDELVKSTNFLVKSGVSKTGSLVSCCLSFLKASRWSGVEGH